MFKNTWIQPAALALCTLLSGAASAQTPVTVTYSFGGLPIPIANDSLDVISIAQIIVPQAIKMTTVTARVKLEYPNTGDLRVYLYSPIGTRTILLEHNCSIANVDTTFADSAPSPWKDFCPAEAGRGPFRGNEPLSNFNNDDSAFGTWRLAVENDQSDSRSGWIRDFSLTITGTPQGSPVFRADTIVNAASLAGTGSIAPGEVVHILGIGVGPTQSVSAGVGALPTTLGGATVLINGTAVPISYAGLYRLTVQVPYGVTPGTNATLQVNSNSTASSPLTLPVVDSSPGLYTVSGLGTGPVKAINQSGSNNSTVSPAPKGNYLFVYASGLGAVSPALTAGSVPPASPLSPTVSAVAASIGGVPAPVTFAGAAPGYPGYYQLNIQVPMNASSGSQELVISINGKASQSGATVTIQ